MHFWMMRHWKSAARKLWPAVAGWNPQTAAEFGKLDPNAIALVRDEAWPTVESVDELHDALMSLGACTEGEIINSGWTLLFDQLVQTGRAVRVINTFTLKVATERLPMIRAIYTDIAVTPEAAVPVEYASLSWDRGEAIIELIRGRLQASGPGDCIVVITAV